MNYGSLTRYQIPKEELTNSLQRYHIPEDELPFLNKISHS